MLCFSVVVVSPCCCLIVFMLCLVVLCCCVVWSLCVSLSSFASRFVHLCSHFASFCLSVYFAFLCRLCETSFCVFLWIFASFCGFTSLWQFVSLCSRFVQMCCDFCICCSSASLCSRDSSGSFRNPSENVT